MKASTVELEGVRVLLLKTQKELERCKIEGESMREEVRSPDLFHHVSLLVSLKPYSWTCLPW